MKRYAAAFGGACLMWACDLSDTSPATLLTLALDDSLSAYDSIRVDILHPSGKPYREGVFSGRYVPGPGHALEDLDLGRSPPARYQVLITAYRDTARALVFGIKVGPEGAGTPQVLVRAAPPDTGNPAKATPALRVVIKAAGTLALTAGGQAIAIAAEVQPPEADQGLLWSSSDTAVARVDAGGLVFPLSAGEADIVARAGRDTALSASLHARVAARSRVNGMRLAPDRAVVYVGGERLRIDAGAVPEDAGVRIMFASRDPQVADVSPEGVVSAVRAGETDILAFPEGSPSLALACRVTVRRDIPVLEAGGERTARPGDTLVFPVKATQEYGTVAVLKWDLDGDGSWDDSTDTETAAPRRAYDGTDSLITALFHVRDGEGNIAESFVRVKVGRETRLPAPVFRDGTSPSPTANPRPTWVWAGAPGGTGRFRISLDQGPETETRAVEFTADSLAEGEHILALRELDAFGSSSATVTRAIRIVASSLKVVILSPWEGFHTNAAAIQVAWTEQTAGASPIRHEDPENLAGRQGRIVIVREAADSLGGRASDSVVIYRDTVPPPAPAFTDSSSPGIVNASYAWPLRWVWTRGGAEGDRFLVSLNGASPAEQASTIFFFDPPRDQVHTLEVREIDSAGNVSPPVRRSVEVDRIAPLPPGVSGSMGPQGPAWSWSAAAGSGGTGIFRFRLSGSTAWSDETAATAFSPAGPVSGDQVLEVQERDAAGNWSESGVHTLTFP